MSPQEAQKLQEEIAELLEKQSIVPYQILKNTNLSPGEGGILLTIKPITFPPTNPQTFYIFIDFLYKKRIKAERYSDTEGWWSDQYYEDQRFADDAIEIILAKRQLLRHILNEQFQIFGRDNEPLKILGKK